MRALYNPTRMLVIQQSTEQLLKKITSACPRCSAPGFDVEQVNYGLPCAWCGRPTNSILSLVYQCRRCGYQKVHYSPQGKDKADPGTCNHCNP
jgi:C4-type Zn-finger protein